jgi:hypothetical protein
MRDLGCGCGDGVGMVHHITMQHPQLFSFFGCSRAVTTGGFQFGLGLGVSPIGGVSCTLGMVLYPIPVFGRGGSGLLDD